MNGAVKPTLDNVLADFREAAKRAGQFSKLAGRYVLIELTEKGILIRAKMVLPDGTVLQRHGMVRWDQFEEMGTRTLVPELDEVVWKLMRAVDAYRLSDLKLDALRTHSLNRG